MFVVFVMKWEESERGWGVRPDGYSYHLTEEDYNDYFKKYWDGMPDEIPDEIPDEYSRPSWDKPKPEVVEVTIFERVSKEKSIRVW